MHVYYINLDRRPEKRISFEKQIEKTKFKDHYKRFAGVDCNNGRVGCANSHIELWEKCVNENIEILVFEDDTIFKDCYDKNIEIALSNKPEDYDMLYFYVAPECSVYPYNKYYWKIKAKCWGTVNYLISPKGAKKLLDRLKPFDYSKKQQIDGQISNLIYRKEIDAYVFMLETVYTIQDFNTTDCQQKRDRIDVLDFHLNNT